MSDLGTITLDAVACRLALTPEQVTRARVLLGGQDEAAVQLVLATCRQAQRETAPEPLPVHRLNAAFVAALAEAEERDRAA